MGGGDNGLMGGGPPIPPILDNRQNFNKGTKIHTIEIWNIDSKKYPEILSSEYFGILIPNSN